MIKAAGDDNSAFVSCRGEAGERLTWSHLTPGSLEAGGVLAQAQLVSVSTQPGDRVHTETRPGALDLVFRSIQQGDEGNCQENCLDISDPCYFEGEYICSHASDPDSNVKFDLVVVQPISFGDTPKTQVGPTDYCNAHTDM